MKRSYSLTAELSQVVLSTRSVHLIHAVMKHWFRYLMYPAPKIAM